MNACSSCTTKANCLKATLTAEWISEKEFRQPSHTLNGDTNNVPSNNLSRFPQLTERQRKIYDTIKKASTNDTINDTTNDTVNDTVNAQSLSEALGMSVITIKRDLYVLRDMNLIKYIGSNKTGHWEVL